MISGAFLALLFVYSTAVEMEDLDVCIPFACDGWFCCDEDIDACWTVEVPRKREPFAKGTIAIGCNQIEVTVIWFPGRGATAPPDYECLHSVCVRHKIVDLQIERAPGKATELRRDEILVGHGSLFDGWSFNTLLIVGAVSYWCGTFIANLR